jgi:hypothetical protein
VLLTVVLVSAILILSSLMFGAQLMAETRITKTDAVFKNALSLAEVGLNTTLSEIKNSTSNTWAQQLQYMYDNSTTYVGPTVVVASMHGTYQIGIRLADHIPPAGNQYTGTIEIDSTGVEYPPSVAVADGMVTNADYSARRRIQTRATAVWTYTPYQTPNSKETPITFGIGYGVFTGGDFSTQGSAMEINGDIYAGGNADIKKDSISGGKVYATGTLTGNPPAGSGYLPSIPFPVIDTSYYRSLFTAYINGTFPYDTPFNQIPGAAPGTYYTCTNAAYVGNQRSTYHVDDLAALTSEVTIDGKIYKTIPSGNATAALAYMTNSTASYFVSGDLHVNAQVTLTGTVVVDGTIFVNGGANILAGTKMPALLATGDFVKNAGNATINGLVYTERSFTGVGTADIVGALYARGAVTMNGNMSITYDSSIDAVVIGTTKEDLPPTEHEPFYQMDDVRRLDQSGRSWVELAPGS